MTNTKSMSEAREGLNKAKIEAAKELSLASNYEYKGTRTSKENGSLVKKMVEEYERNLLGK